MGSNVSMAVQQAGCHLIPPTLERSGRETPVSVDSIPLEWDHTVDVGGSSSPEDDEELTYCSALSGMKTTTWSWCSPKQSIWLLTFSCYFDRVTEMCSLWSKSGSLCLAASTSLSVICFSVKSIEVSVIYCYLSVYQNLSTVDHCYFLLFIVYLDLCFMSCSVRAYPDLLLADLLDYTLCTYSVRRTVSKYL